MARGRFISNAVIIDSKINKLSSDTSRLGFIYAITLADCEGRITGNEYLLKASLFPLNTGVTPEDCKSFAAEWAELGLITWYEDKNGEKIIQFPNFDKHQKGLRKDREAESNFAEWGKGCKLISGVNPELLQSKSGLMLSKGNDNGNKNENENGESAESYPQENVDKINKLWLDERFHLTDQSQNLIHHLVMEKFVIAEDVEKTFQWYKEKGLKICEPEKMQGAIITQKNKRVRPYTH